jgi:hypothetical protein
LRGWWEALRAALVPVKGVLYRLKRYGYAPQSTYDAVDLATTIPLLPHLAGDAYHRVIST